MFGFKNRNIVSYALSGGSAYGFAHIGVIKYLEEKGIFPSAICGSSMGALIGGLYAYGLSSDSLIKIAKDFSWLKIIDLFLRPSINKGGLIDSFRIRDYLKTFVKDTYIEELKIPFVATAVDIFSGKEIDIYKGPLIDAMISSMSIPTAFNPYYYNDMHLVDGGLRNNLPFDIARCFSKKVIGVNVLPHFNIDYKKEENDKKNMVRDIIKKRGKIIPVNESEYSYKIENKIIDTNKKNVKNKKDIFDNITANSLAIMHLEGRRKMKLDNNKVIFNIDLNGYKLIDFNKAVKIVDAGYNQMLDKEYMLTPFIKK